MTAQLAAGLKRSIFPAILAALAAAGAAAGQVGTGANPTQVGITIGYGAFMAGAIVLIRGVGEGLNDAQRASIGNVLESDVTPVALAEVTKLLTPYATRALRQAGLQVTPDQVQAVAQNAESQLVGAITQAVAETQPAVHPAVANATPPAPPS